MRTLADALRWRARRHPDLPASWFQGRTRTFAELNHSTPELAKVVDDAECALMVAGEDFQATAAEAGHPALTFSRLPRKAGGDDPYRDSETRVAWQLYT